MKALQISLLSLMISGLSMPAMAGMKWVDIGINGLTCSMCSRSVEMSVSKLNFVDNVAMSLEKTEGRVYLKSGVPVDLKKIAQAVTDAGFSIRFLQVQFNFNDIAVSANGLFNYQGQSYVWIDFRDEYTKGEFALKLVDEGFLPRKESSLWKKKIALSSSRVDQKVFHVIHA